ncbi:MAG: hypothetical protein LBB72_05315 [Spirochaetaceae bacterium]|nr:hypothetical protein [Spirochaetaceae bacterium]
MKKKFVWFAALLAALTLVFIGCGSNVDEPPDGGEEKISLESAFSATEIDQGAATVTVGEHTFSFTGTSTNENDQTVQGKLTTPETNPLDWSSYLGFKFDYKSSGNYQIILVCDTTGGTDKAAWIFKYNGTDGWNAVPSADDWTPLEVSFANFGKAWGAETATAVDLTTIHEILFQIPSGPNQKTFSLQNFALINDPNSIPQVDPPLGADSTFTEGSNAMLSDVFIAGTGATLNSSPYVKLGKKNNDTVIQVAPQPKIADGEKVDEFRLGINLNPALNISDAEKLVISWISGSQTQGNFNIKLTMANYSPAAGIETNDAALQKENVGNTNGEIHFVTNHASGWGGWEGPALDDTDGKCTFIEIFSDDPRLKRQYLYFTSINIPNAADWDGGDEGGDESGPFTVFGGGTLGTGVTIQANEKGITHSVQDGKIKVNKDTTNNEFRLLVKIDPAVDISGLSDFVLEFDLDGGTSLGGANISIYTSDSKKAGVAGWGKTSPAKYNFTSDHQSWLGVKVSETNGWCTGFEIYSDSSGSVLSINSIKFE